MRALTHPFGMINQNVSRVDIYQGPLEYRCYGNQYAVNGSITLQLDYSPGLWWSIPFSGTGLSEIAIRRQLFGSPADEALIIQSEQLLSNGHWGEELPSEDEQDVLRMGGLLTNPQSHGDGSTLQIVNFWVVNGPGMWDIDSYQGPDGSRRRLYVDTNDWIIALSVDSGIETLIPSREYAITHTGSVIKRDQITFTAAEAMVVLDVISTSLSFATGRRVATILPVGAVDTEDGPPCWAHLENPVIDPATGRWPPTWYDPGNGGRQIKQVMMGLLREWADPYRKKVIINALEYYRSANNPGSIPSAVSQAVSGLTLLSYATLVTETQKVTKAEWAKCSAGEQIRQLLEECAIAFDIPAEFTELEQVRRKRAERVRQRHPANASIDDGVSAVVELRNAVMHPSPGRLEDTPMRAWDQGWALIMHWYETVLLSRLQVKADSSPRMAKIPVKMRWTTEQILRLRDAGDLA
jgi:hypothetical protein